MKLFEKIFYLLEPDWELSWRYKHKLNWMIIIINTWGFCISKLFYKSVEGSNKNDNFIIVYPN